MRICLCAVAMYYACTLASGIKGKTAEAVSLLDTISVAALQKMRSAMPALVQLDAG